MRVQKFECVTPDLSETAVLFHEAKAAVEKKTGPVALAREHLFTYVQCEPKNNDEVAHQQLPSNFAISFNETMVYPRPRGPETKASRSFSLLVY